MMPLSQRKKSDPDTSQTRQTAVDWQTHGRGAGLAKRIWMRCDKTSGIAIRRFRLAFERRHPLAGKRRLLLLDTLLKRWGPADDSYSRKAAVAIHLWPSRWVDSPDTGGRCQSMRFNSQSGGNVPRDIESMRSLGEKKEAKVRLEAIETSSGRESNRLQAPVEERHEQPPAGAGIVRSRNPAISSGEKVLMAAPLAAGIIARQDREHSQGGPLSNFKSSPVFDLPVPVSAVPHTGRMEAPIWQRRKRPADRHDPKFAAVPQPPAGSQEKRIAQAGSPIDVAGSVKTSAAAGSLRPAAGQPGAAIIRRHQHQSVIERKLSAAGPLQSQANRESIGRHRVHRPSSTVKRWDAVVVQEKIVKATDDTRVSFQPTTVKTDTGSSLQSTGRSGGRSMPIQADAVGGTHPDDSGTASAASGLTAPAAGTGSGKDLAADIIRRHGRMTAGRFILTKMGGIQMGPAADLCRLDDVMISPIDEHSPADAPVPSSAQDHAVARAFSENRPWPRMMIHRTFVTAGAAGSRSDPSEPAINTSSASAVSRPLAAMGTRTRRFGAMSMATGTGRTFPSPAGDAARRSLLQLSVSDLPISAGGRSRRSSGFEFGGDLDTPSRLREPRNSGSENDSVGSADLEQLVDKVLQKLMRRIAVERERRGLQRWP